ncbi:MAG TPA: CAP domain-containing protein [Candidatus Saccharimonadales bacterium]|nr:CAP domain-containing protein [Candidatus Saccharimonadales bacterium]
MVLARVSKPRETVHGKKRAGRHHDTGNTHYGKTYWPYLPMVMLVVFGFYLSSTWHAGKAVLGYATNVSTISLLQETNIQRGANSMGALTMNSKLSAAAQAKANDMVARNYWSHTAPDGKQPWQFISDAGYVYATAAENLAYGFDSSSAAMAGWMNSAGHRANILNAGLTEVGFGIANSANYQNVGEQTVIVAMYGKPQQVVTPNSAQYGTSPTVTARVGNPTTKKAETPAQAAPATPEATPTPAAETPAPADTTPTTTKEDTVVPDSKTAEAATQNLEARQVARIDVLTNGNAGRAAGALAIIALLCVALFFIRHARLWHRLLVKGEGFIIHHPFLDTAVVAVAVVAVLLSQTTGFIR